MGAKVRPAWWNAMPSRWMAAALALMAFALIAPALRAHEGHDHGAPPTPVSTTIAPRIDASSTTFELIAVYRNQCADDLRGPFRHHEPVTGAQIEVDTPKGAVTAKENPDGTYVVPVDWAASGGSYDLIFTVTVVLTSMS